MAEKMTKGGFTPDAMVLIGNPHFNFLFAGIGGEFTVARSMDELPEALKDAVSGEHGEEPFNPFFITRFPALLLVFTEATLCIQHDIYHRLVLSVYHNGRITYRQNL